MSGNKTHSGPRAPRAAAFIGPYGGGKTSLCEALLDAAGLRLRHAGDTRTPEPGTETKLVNCSFLEDRWSLLDCPGSIEFQAEATAALAVADIAVVVADPDPARAMALRPAFAALEAAGTPFILFINKVDTLAVPPAELIAALQAETATKLVPRQLPLMEQGKVAGYVDLISERAYRYRERQPSEMIPVPTGVAADEQAAHDELVDTLADRDDSLLEKIVEGEAVSATELFAHLRHDLGEGKLAEVMFGAATHGNGVQRLWKALRHDTPEPTQTRARHRIETEGGALAQVFKVSYAGQAGKLAYARVWRGPLQDGAADGQMRVGGIFSFPGNETQKLPQAETGDVVALGRLDGAVPGTVFGAAEGILTLPAPPPPVYALAIAVPDHKDDVRLSTALAKVLEEDPALSLMRDAETGDTLLAGQGEAHLARALDRLNKGWGLSVSAARPKLRLKETIKLTVHEHSRLKRQTGGHGQFADVKLEIAPRQRGEGFSFTDKVTGGAVPRQYIPAVAAAAEEAMAKGPFGYPVVDVAVTLLDGGFHSVDSSDMAFRTATRNGIAEALTKAEPVLLEPVHRVTISAPNMFTSTVQRLLSGKRGQIMGYGEKPAWPGWDETQALLPEAETHRLILELRSQTAGLGGFVHEFDHLAEASPNLADRVARQAAQ
ncbi:elongation factor G [Acidocella aminolytica]|uniref:Elongation factor G n=1 Tax=Acidocella aminolytica 101 = DSM 11237 TaxID=1120923 RepID=A0A0D6PHT5_9PROT|nr:elongation factor G [Acidocella aminolytica]GAN81330.1 elongation factor G [Acidocella aminolytica 101 = DSM 11237]GBQ42062.1 translation elongation factor [Acidocella aminolytica 101 = DSM 11237]SHF49951.1 translation elongation factor 2 (EF-2/EF-G) [Acidocella aminolytica 101 = DSM 11237]